MLSKNPYEILFPLHENLERNQKKREKKREKEREEREKRERITVMTYNVSWEALESKDSRSAEMSHCKNKDENNECTNNIVTIITSSQPHDFIFLQEIRMENPNQSRFFMEQMKENGLENMEGIGTDVHPIAGIITMFDRDKYNIVDIKQGDFLTHENDETGRGGRNFLIIVFSRKSDQKIIITINLHAPHHFELNDDKSSIVFNTIRSNVEPYVERYNDPIIIVGGDFNENFNNEYIRQEYRSSLLGNQKLNGFHPFPPTCCTDGRRKNRYSLHFDQLAVSEPYQISYIGESEIETYNKYWKDEKPFMSDHLPIVATIYRP